MHTPVRDTFLVFGAPLIEEPEIREVVDVLRSGWVSTGPRVGKFEEMFRDYTGARHARSLSSCTAALHLSMIVSGVRAGDEVITSPMTFAATANVITHVGAVPVFADVDRRTMNIDPAEIRKKITPRTKAIIPVHFAGRPCAMDEIMAIARERRLVVIEDAAHAIETVYRGKKVGHIGDLTCFSFYVTKNIITGEGGMVTTDNEDWAARIEMYGLHGMSKGAWRRYTDDGFKHYQVVYPGYKYNMTDMQAALGIHQLPRIERYLRRREEIWRRYDEAFKGLPLTTPAPPDPDTVHARHLYTPLIDIDRIGRSRDEIQAALHRENIGTGIHFMSVHLHDYYRRTYGHARGDFPNAEYISDRTISLPLSAKLADGDVGDVIAAVRKVLS
ncbi:MAG: DegT/DnrJ/EryC1/StrS family aminotransferase [Candidatus Aureabacteria bacterium]|nr:DegT/DnrJ/EryC1/StrS family aminotransferase [Candidatus Auribacterota bacterium]